MFPVSVLLAHPSNRLWPIRAKPIGLAPRRPGIADKQQPNTKGDHHDARKSFLPSQDARLPRAPSGQFRWKPRPLAPNTSASILSLRIATDRTGSLTTTRAARLPEPLTEVACPSSGASLARTFQVPTLRPPEVACAKGGVLIRDSEGDEVPDRETACQLGLEIVQDMLRLPHVYGEMREWQTNEFVIADETGATVLILPFAESEFEG
jgi:hypothetical protein